MIQGRQRVGVGEVRRKEGQEAWGRGQGGAEGGRGGLAYLPDTPKQGSSGP